MITSYFDSNKLQDNVNDSIGIKINKLTLGEIPDAYYCYELFQDFLSEMISPKHWKAARTELNIFLIWCYDIECVSVAKVKRQLLRKYIEWCKNPPLELIGTSQRHHFIVNDLGQRVPNPDWKPFVKRSPKTSNVPSNDIQYEIKQISIKNKLSILSSLYTFLIDCDYLDHNPAVALLKSFGRTTSMQNNSIDDSEDIKSFTKIEYEYVLKAARMLAELSPEDERILFAITIMFTLYPRLSEISARNGFSPIMGQFRQNELGSWLFYVPLSKHGKSRNIGVSDETIEALKRYRHSLGLPELPPKGDTTPLLLRKVMAKHGRAKGITFASIGEKQLFSDTQKVLDFASNLLLEDGYIGESESVRSASPHTFRHTGISADINWHNRTLAQVRDDAGHSSIDTTSRYLWTVNNERYQSAKGKKLDLNHLK